MSNKSPQNYRIFSASLLAFSSKLALWLVLLACLSVNVYYRLTTLSFWQKNQAVLEHPLSSAEHIRGAQTAWADSDWLTAKNELMVAASLKNQGISPNVLGASAAPIELLNEWEQEPARLTEEERFWQTVIGQKTDYRDAYIQLSALNYQLNNDQKAVSYLASARILDPNFPYVQKLTGLLETKSK